VGLRWKRFLLGRKVRKIARAIERCAKGAAQEPLWVTHYGAFDIHPRHLVYWICVKSDTERDRLASDQALMTSLRRTLVDCDYPLEGRSEVHIGFESQETVDRESDGNWWYHWK